MNDLLAEKLARLTPQQRALLVRSLQPKSVEVVRPISRREDARAPLPLTPAQQRMWFLEQLQPGSGVYYVYNHMRLRGPLDREAMIRAWHELVRRHESLRTTFSTVDGEPRQIVHDATAFDVELVEGGDEQHWLNRSLAPFDLEHGPLLRVTLARLAPDEHLLLVTLHHIIADGWSLDVLESELRALYRGETLAEPELQFGDFAVWQAAPDHQARLAAQLDWWQQTLAGVPDALELPSDRPRPNVQSFRGGRVTTYLSPETTAKLQQLALSEHATPFMLLLAAFESVLARLSGQRDFVVGTPVAARTPVATEALVGMFVNTVGLRATLDGDPTFRELVHRVRDTALDAFAHQEVPLERVVDALGLERVANRTPLFQTMLVVTAGTASHDFEGVRAEYLHPQETTARFDLTLAIAAVGDGLRAFFDYAADLFDAATAEMWARAFVNFVDAAAANPDTPVSRLPLLDAVERASVLARSEGRRVAREETTLDALFAAQVQRTPDAPAVVTPERTLTYAELDLWSDELAREVRGPITAFRADRSAEAIASVLAILKAGSAYLPIDPSLPEERAEWMLRDAGAQWLWRTDNPVCHSEADRIVCPPSPTSPAYLIYTSGSTGTPKGVLVEHRSVVNLALAFIDSHGFAGHRLLMIPPLAFDASVGDVFPALFSGAALVLHPSPAELNALELARFCDEQGVTALDAPAALWRRWTEEWSARGIDDPLPLLRLMMVGGESIPTDDVRRFARLTHGRVQFVNHYGPTEATVCATTCHTIDASELSSTELPIGRPVDNVIAYVLDEHFEPVPDGVAGELFLGGIGVARGYHGREELTRERFVPDPFASEPGARMYRTGDLARRLRDGSLLFLGRSDRQIKLRGYRIEPGEIEAALLAQPGVRAAVVVARDQQLVAYCAGEASLDALRGRLPAYMIPSALVTLDALPLTTNGKIDLRALPEPPRAQHASRAPRNDDERALLAIWSEVTGRELAGIDDDFFAHGGDSLKTMPLMFKVQQRFGVELPLSAIFAAPTVARFAPLLKGGWAEAESLEAKAAEFSLTIDPALPRAATPPRAILLTGATGFLGAFLLDELLHASDAEVYCLVRANDRDDALRRIAANLAAYGLRDDLSRVVPLLGDLAAPRLGLDDATRAHLAVTLDLIIHNGGYVSFVKPYELHEAANVHGTRELLRLAAEKRIKPLHHVSTLGVHFTSARVGASVFESDSLPPGADVMGGYNQSKWVADADAQTARAAGLPVTIHRPSRISADSRSGAFNGGDFFCTWVKGCVELGCFPEQGALHMTPVDVVARSIVTLALSGEPPRDVHYFNHDGLAHEDFVALLREQGVDCDVAPYATWKESLLRAGDNAFAKFTSFLGDGTEGEAFFDTAASERLLAQHGVICPPVREFTARWIAAMVAQQFLEAGERVS